MVAAIPLRKSPSSPGESSETTTSSMYSETSSMTATKDEVVDLDTLDLDALLSTAKSNLQRDLVSSQVQNGRVIASDSTATTPIATIDEGADDLATVKKAISSLPHLIDTFSKDHLLAIAKEFSESASSTVKDMKFRQISDPVAAKKAKKAERESNAGARWFNMPRPELTPSLRRDWQLLQMRSVLDPKRHYKKDTAPIPKFFQTGTIVEGNTEFFSARVSKKDRKQTFADELLANDKAKDYYKRKFAEIQAQKQSGRTKHYKKVKEMRQKQR